MNTLSIFTSTAVFVLASTAIADTALPTSNRNPLTINYGLPTPVQLDNTSSVSMVFNTGVYNVSSDSTAATGTADETIILDGEIYIAELQPQWRIAKNQWISLNIPFIGHNTGNGDHSIEQWHQWFGLPNGNRDQREQDQLLYQYTRNGQTRLKFDKNNSGIGDVSLSWQRQFTTKEFGDHRDTNALASVMRVSLQIPTGSESKLTGSDSWDISADFTTGQLATTSLPNLNWQVGVGVLWSSRQGLLNDFRKDLIAYGSASLGYKLTSALRAFVQLDYHTAIYDSELPELGRNATQLAIGGQYDAGERFRLSLYFTEDIEIKTSPDFGLGISISTALKP